MQHHHVGFVFGGHLKLPVADDQVGVVGDDLLAVALGHGQGFDVGGLQLHDAHADLTDDLQVGVGQLLFHQHLLQGGVLRAHVLAVEGFGAGVLFSVGGTDQKHLLGLVVTGVIIIGKLKVFGAGFGPAVTGDGQVHGIHGHGSLAGVKVHGLDLQGHAQFTRDELRQGHVEAHILLLAGLGGIHKLHGAEIGRQGHGQHAGLLDIVHFIRQGGHGQGGGEDQGQHQAHHFLHHHFH